MPHEAQLIQPTSALPPATPPAHARLTTHRPLRDRLAIHARLSTALEVVELAAVLFGERALGSARALRGGQRAAVLAALAVVERA